MQRQPWMGTRAAPPMGRVKGLIWVLEPELLG